MERLRCVVERITYQNEQNGYSVIKCKAKGYSELVTVVGAMPEVHVGAVLSLTGEWKMDSKYGRQFSIESFEETLPATVLGIEKYLGSGLVKGIGPKFAKRIVQEFGSDTLQVIEDEPDRLLQVPGIGRVCQRYLAQGMELHADAQAVSACAVPGQAGSLAVAEPLAGREQSQTGRRGAAAGTG